jgi:sensor histidine kinase regulating citrate/malate metabolism
MLDGFWENIARYPRYLITVLLGVVLNTIAPIAPLFQRPLTAIATFGFLVGLLVFVSLTLRAMLGLSPI